MIKLSSLCVGVLLLLGAGCRRAAVPDPVLADADRVINTRVNFDKLPGKWNFTHYLNDQTVPAGGKADIEFTEGTRPDEWRVDGRSFINLYVTAFRFNEAQSGIYLTEPVGTTKIGGSPELMRAETAFIRYLKNVNKFSVEGSVLKLYVGEPASEIMFFKRP